MADGIAVNNLKKEDGDKRDQTVNSYLSMWCMRYLLNP